MRDPNHSAPHYLRFEGISKTYPGVAALTDVTFGVAEGSVHALLGENGAGKSTLLKALSGAHLPTSGTLRIGGKEVVFKNTTEAINAGVAVIYQELHLVPEMSVAENLFLGHLPAPLGIVDRQKLRQLTIAQLERFGENIDPNTPVKRLSIAQRQMVEIAKALSRGAKVIAFDEPTSSLSSREIQKLFEIIKDLQQQGCAILYVTHRMEEVFRVCDSATVLRDGKLVVSWETMAEVTQDKIVKAMVGRELKDIYAYRPRPHGPAAMEVEMLSGADLKVPVSFTVRQGEILGMFGLVGAGRSEVLRLVFGADRSNAGTIKVRGKAVNIRTPADAIREGVLLCPEDRKKEGIVPIRSVQENINISARRNNVWLGTLLDEQWEHRNAADKIKQLAIKTPSAAQLLRNLSGGNQQKVILARWLSEEIKVILLDEPTRGIDVGAKSEIYSIIYKLAEQGIGVVVVSSDLPEVLGISDRVLVMREGKIAADLSREEATPQRTLELALPKQDPIAAGLTGHS